MKLLRLIFETAVLLVNYTLIDLALCGLVMRFRTHWLYILILAGGVWTVENCRRTCTDCCTAAGCRSR